MLGQGGFLGVQYPALLAVRVLHGVIDADVPQVEGILQNAVGVGPRSTVGYVGRHAPRGDTAFVGYLPFSGEGGEVHLDEPVHVQGRFQQLKGKLPDIGFVHPGSAQAHVDLGSVQVLGLRMLQRCDAGRKTGVRFGGLPGVPELLPDVAGQVSVGGFVAEHARCVLGAGHGENHSLQRLGEFLRAFAGELRHVA